MTLKRFTQGEKLRIFDCRGVDRIPTYRDAFQGNLMKIISGHIKKGYQVKTIFLEFVLVKNFVCSFVIKNFLRI